MNIVLKEVTLKSNKNQMDANLILKEIETIFRDILDEEDITLNLSTSANDVEGWDSLTHIQLIVAAEKRFKIKFKAKEFHSWKTIGDMIQSIQSKL